MLQSIDIDALPKNVKMSDKSSFAYTPKAHHTKLIQAGFTSLIIAMGLFLCTLGAQNVTPVRAASHSMPAGDLSVVGQPSLPASTVDSIFKILGSPMSGLGKVVVQASQQTNVDDAFALAVWWTETNDGAAGVGLADRNPGSVRGSVGYPSAFDGYTIYPSYSAAINYWFNMLKNMYVNRGLSTVYAISHPYVGTSSSPLWAGKVVALMLKYRGEAPPLHHVGSHGKYVAEPAVHVHATPTPLVYQPQRQASIPKQANTSSPARSSAYEYIIVCCALLLALAIVAGALWMVKKRPIYKMQGNGGQGEDERSRDTQGEIMRDTGKQDGDLQGEDLQDGGKPRPYNIRNVRAFRNIALYALQNENAPNTNALINAAQEMHTPKTDDLMMWPQEMDTGANFCVHRSILLPSIPVAETAKSGETPGGSNPAGRSTGLLSRYGKTYQE